MTTIASIRKALVPVVATLIATITEWSVTGSFNALEWRTVAVGIVVAVLTYLVPNTPA